MTLLKNHEVKYASEKCRNWRSFRLNSAYIQSACILKEASGEVRELSGPSVVDRRQSSETEFALEDPGEKENLDKEHTDFIWKFEDPAK